MMHFITFLIIMSLCSSSFCTLLKINNHPYESSSAFYDNLHCLECPYIFASSEDIVTYSNKSYHRRCWRLAHANFWGSKRYWEEEGHPKRGYENLWRFNSFCYLLPLPLAISIRFENEKIPLLVAGLIFGTMLWAEWLLHKANSFRDCITMEKLIETKAPHEAVKYACEHTDKIIQKIDYPTKQHFIHDICKCVECGHFLLQGQELVTLHINNNQNLPYIWAESGVWHQDCFQKHWEYSRQNKLTNDFMAASWAYLKTSINDYFTWLVPTPIHAFNYMAGAYLVYKVYKGQIPKDKMDKIWELILNK